MPKTTNDVSEIKKVRRGALEGKKTVKIYTQDGVRELIVPSNQPNYHPMVITKDRLHIIEEHAAKREVKDNVAERNRLAEESRARRMKFKELDEVAAKRGQKLNDLEEEAKEKSNYLLQRAWELRMEQEDDVKAANSLILKTKCQAIRDAQLAEKQMIRAKLEEENRRAENLAELRRLEMLLEEQRGAERQAVKKDTYVKELAEQVEEINSNKLLDSEKLMQERKRLNEAMFMMMMEEVKKANEQKEANARIRKELAMANEQIKKTRDFEKEEARIADLKVQEWMKQRAEREEGFEREQEEAKKRRELETARLRAMQEKAGDLRAKQDEMAAIRRQEEYEREWRKKEKEAAQKRKEMEDKCLEVRHKQVIESRQIQAMEIAREKREFEKIMKVQQEQQERERLLELKRKQEAEEYREMLLRQMNEKEVELMGARAADLAEGLAVRAEVAKRREQVQRVLRGKLETLRTHKVPEMYIADITRQFNLMEK